MEPKYWLIKSEPETYSIEHLKKDKKTPWTGVRNFQARNFMMYDMQKGDPIFFYHSNCKVPGIYGMAKVASEPYPDPAQFDTESEYFDKRCTPENPLWYLVDVAYVSTLKEPITLEAMRADKKLSALKILSQGNRLSITRVLKPEAEILSNIAD
jgi:predicted RNA-binding protein with PUA-like domain